MFSLGCRVRARVSLVEGNPQLDVSPTVWGGKRRALNYLHFPGAADLGLLAGSQSVGGGGGGGVGGDTCVVLLT